MSDQDRERVGRPTNPPGPPTGSPRLYSPDDLLTPSERVRAERYKRIYPWLCGRDG